MHPDLWHGKLEKQHGKFSFRCCIMRKEIGKELAVGGSFSFFLDSVGTLTLE